MNYNHFLLSAFLLPIVFTMHGQSPDEQRIQQLKDTWYKKVHELVELGEKIITINKKLEDLQEDVLTFWQKNIRGTQQEIDHSKNLFLITMSTFYNNVKLLSDKNMSLKGFLVQELFKNNGDYLPNKEYKGFFDKVKFATMHIALWSALLKKLVEDYEESLQKIIEIENNLLLLGQPSLYI